MRNSEEPDQRNAREESFPVPRGKRWAIYFLGFALIAGQFLVALFETKQFWPLSPMTVYRSLSESLDQSTLYWAYYTDDQENQIARLPGFNYRILKIFGSFFWREESQEWKESVAADLAEYLQEKYGNELIFSGIRVYHLHWTPECGETPESTLLIDSRKS